MYEFLTGPGLWISFVICFGGLALRLAFLFGLSRGKDPALFDHASASSAIRSIALWSVPLLTAAMRKHPVFTLMSFAFHVSLIATPLLFAAHNILWDEAFGVSLPSMNNHAADLFTAILLVSGLFLLIRRAVLPVVRALSSARDYLMLLVVMAPFVTGFLAYHQFGPYDTMMLLHVATGELLLILIPFTRLAHGLLYFLTRAYIGFELGGRRGARSW